MPETIKLENIAFVRDGRRILDNISWSVERGQHCIVLGANGSGKTTLLQIVTGYLWPNEGAVTVFGRRFGKTDIRELRHSIGWVSSAIKERQPTFARALDIVISGKFASIGVYFETITDEHRREACGILKTLDCASIAGKEWNVLSQGERQRVMIARALMAHPKLMILDEPCAGLDMASRESLLVMIERLIAGEDGPTMIMVTHHVEEIVPAFSQALLIKEGRAVANGPLNEALTSETLSQTMGLDLTLRRGNGRLGVEINQPQSFS